MSDHKDPQPRENAEMYQKPKRSDYRDEYVAAKHAQEIHKSGKCGLRRREFLALGGLGMIGGSFALAGGLRQGGYAQATVSKAVAEHNELHHDVANHDHGYMGTVGDISGQELSVFNPSQYLTSWNFNHLPEPMLKQFYRESTLSGGQTLREYLFVGRDREIEIAPGIYFPAWTYNDQVPGPTIRATRGDRIRIWFINEGSHPHTIHFHGWHPYEMDGTFSEQSVQPAKRGLEAPFGPGADVNPWLTQGPTQLRQRGLDIYEFDAEPIGVHLYHCHSSPLKHHIHKGLYGVFVVDPPGSGRPADRRHKIDPDTNEPLPNDHPIHEMMMVMNAFDTNFDGENEVYAVNTFAHHYMRHPIKVKIGDLVRIYLVNLTEFDPINSFHLHAGFFRVYRTGTSFVSHEYTDTVMMCQAERMILEYRFRWPGKYMFHAHQSEFAELGWMGLFEAVDRVA